MVALPHRQRLNLPLAPLGAGVFAASVALVCALLPASMLENLVMKSGIAALVPAAEPPLGFTARAALIMIGGGGVGLIAWFALFLLIGTRSVTLSGRTASVEARDDAPVLRRADAHPDAPARRPLFASRDLGTPFLDVKAKAPVVIDQPAAIAPPVEQPLPVDLDQPLAAFDPQAIPEEPIDWVASPIEVKPDTRPQVFDAGERFETFVLTPPPPPVTPASAPRRAPPRVEVDPSASIHALLDRLEKSVVRRETVAPSPPPPPRESLQESLASLRRLATRTG